MQLVYDLQGISEKKFFCEMITKSPSISQSFIYPLALYIFTAFSLKSPTVKKTFVLK